MALLYSEGSGDIVDYEGERAGLSDLSLCQRDLANFILDRFEWVAILRMAQSNQIDDEWLNRYRVTKEDLPIVIKRVVLTKCTRFIPSETMTLDQIRHLLKWSLWGMDEPWDESHLTQHILHYQTNYPIYAQWLRQMLWLMAHKKEH